MKFQENNVYFNYYVKGTLIERAGRFGYFGIVDQATGEYFDNVFRIFEDEDGEYIDLPYSPNRLTNRLFSN